MKKRSKKLVAMIVAMFMVFTVFFTSTSASADPLTLHYVALGDSVAYGMSAYVTPPTPVYFGYADMLEAALDDFGPVDYVNAGVPGIDSYGLFIRVKYCPINRPLVMDRDLVTINIGGNNLLKPFVAAVFAAYGVVVEGEVDNIEIALLAASINAMGPVEAQARYAALNDPDGPLAAAFKMGVQNFKKEFPRIIGSVRQLAPDSMIIVNTLYNPLKPGDPLYSFIDKSVGQINKTINSLAEDGRYAIADVYNAFKYYEGPMDPVMFDPIAAVGYAIGGNMAGFAMSIDPHPNTIGHMIITELQLQIYTNPF
ncbi:MAG: SGNH/GDSL hydrolase family protein [Youngiibacter sp.]|nr:SGNH/GDSL hydrolase family protein [Youngiibacter sp.]